MSVEYKHKLSLQRGKKVYQIDLSSNEIIKIWRSIAEASRTLSINKCGISSTCNGIQKSAGGFYWQHA